MKIQSFERFPVFFCLRKEEKKHENWLVRERFDVATNAKLFSPEGGDPRFIKKERRIRTFEMEVVECCSGAEKL